MQPKVSVLTISYNQEKYIEQALDSIISQEVSFPIEVIVADDASIDSTPEIIERYAKKYPFIKPIFRKKNIGAVANSIDTLKSASGEYIALCEGDDYWLDVHKLQKQVDFLDAHLDYGLCFHPVRVFFENKEEEDTIWPNPESTFTNKKLLEENFIPTNSVLYRRTDYSSLNPHTMPFDWYLHLFHSRNGKIKFMSRTMSAYRRHSSGLWWSAYKDLNAYWQSNYAGYFEIDKFIYENYATVYPREVKERLLADFRMILPRDTIEKSPFNRAVAAYPELVVPYILTLESLLKKSQADTENERNKIINLTQKINNLSELYAEQTKKSIHSSQELSEIYSTRLWRYGIKLRGYKNLILSINKAKLK